MVLFQEHPIYEIMTSCDRYQPVACKTIRWSIWTLDSFIVLLIVLHRVIWSALHPMYYISFHAMHCKVFLIAIYIILHNIHCIARYALHCFLYIALYTLHCPSIGCIQFYALHTTHSHSHSTLYIIACTENHHELCRLRVHYMKTSQPKHSMLTTSFQREKRKEISIKCKH